MKALLTPEQESILAYSNPGDTTLNRIRSAIAQEHAAGRTLEESWAETTKILAGKKAAYLGDPDMDDTAESPYTMVFAKGSSELDTVLAGIACKQIEHHGLPQAEKLTLRDKGHYGMTVRSVGTHWDDPSHTLDELLMSPGSIGHLQHLLPEGCKMDMDARQRSAGHMVNSQYSR
jgi:hypothetical protein